MALFTFDRLQFDYEPYPIAFQADVVDPDNYEQMLSSWPATELFAYLPQLGLKYSLSERNNPHEYDRVVSREAIWKAVYAEIKSRAFIEHVLEMLRVNQVDLGLKRDCGDSRSKRPTLLPRWLQLLNSVRRRSLSSRFEFSMMPSSGGCIKPHTDSPSKIITLVFTITRPGEWAEEWGGGTDVLRMRDPARSFNIINRQADFTETDVVRTFPFVPNQVVIFVKTFNSWHGVRPMRGASSSVMRRTLTVNIETNA
jgi:hypothetical protein